MCLACFIALLTEAVIVDCQQGKTLKTEQRGEINSLLEISELHYEDYDDTYYSRIKSFQIVRDEGRLVCLDFPATYIGSVALEFESPLTEDSLVVLNWNQKPIYDYMQDAQIVSTEDDGSQKDCYSPYKTTRMQVYEGNDQFIFSLPEGAYTHLDFYVQKEYVLKDVKYSPQPLSVTSRNFQWMEAVILFAAVFAFLLLICFLLPAVTDRAFHFVKRQGERLYATRKSILRWCLIIAGCIGITALYEFGDYVSNDCLCSQKAIFCFCLLMITSIMWFNRKHFRENLDKILPALIVLEGFMIAGSSITGNSSFDTDIHYHRALKSSYFFSDTAVITQSDAFYIDCGERYEEDDSKFSTFVNFRVEQSSQELAEGRNVLDTMYHSGNYYLEKPLRNYRAIAYLPHGIILLLGRVLHLPFSIMYLLGRCGNLLIYAVFMTLAMRRLTSHRLIFAVFALLPMHLLLAGNYSYDTFLTALITFGFVCFIENFKQADRPISYYQLFGYLTCIIIGISSKPVFFPFLLLPLFYPKHKFKTSKQRTVCYILCLLSTLLLMILLYCYREITMEGDIDPRVLPGINSTLQMQYVLSHPIHYFLILLKFNFKFFHPNQLTHILGDWKTYGHLPEWLCFFSLLLIIQAVLLDSDNSNEVPGNKTRKLKYAVIGCSVFCLILVCTAFYCAVTPVGMGDIYGVQPRYYIPLMFPLTSIISKTGIRRTTQKPVYEIALIGGAALNTVLAVNVMIIQNITM